jgi:DNA-directed RNA polymerase subunit RPC12/RpoP
MNKTLNAVKRGLEAGVKAASEPINPHSKYKVAGQQVRCSQCSNEFFESGPGLAGIFSGPVLQCTQCGHLEFFGRAEILVENRG